MSNQLKPADSNRDSEAGGVNLTDMRGGNKIGARKNACFLAISTAPSINRTPLGPCMVPVPYPTVQDLSNSVSPARSVRFNACQAYLLEETTQPNCKGDDPGTGKGIRSGTVNGEVQPRKGCSTVRIEGKQIVREGDPCTMNGGNNPGIYVYVPQPSSTPFTPAASSPAGHHLMASFDAPNPLGLPEPVTLEAKIAAMMQRDVLSGTSALERTKAMFRNQTVGPVLRKWDPDAEKAQFLRTRNRLETSLLSIFGGPGAAAYVLGASEEKIAAANEVGAALMGVTLSMSGIPSRQSIKVGPRTILKSSFARRSSGDGVRIAGRATDAISTQRIDPATMERIRAIPKGSRPDPSAYMSKSAIDAHLAEFDAGGSYLVPKDALNRYGRELLGRPDNTQFVMTKKEMDHMLGRAKGDISIIEAELGIPAGAWKGKELVRIDVPAPRNLGVRVPSGNESGANDLWLPGGRLPTGQLEATVDSIPRGQYTESEIWNLQK
jgi:hypothetical protein